MVTLDMVLRFADAVREFESDKHYSSLRPTSARAVVRCYDSLVACGAMRIGGLVLRLRDALEALTGLDPTAYPWAIPAIDAAYVATAEAIITPEDPTTESSIPAAPSAEAAE